MRFSYDPDVEAFRQEVRQFIAAELPSERERARLGYEGGFRSNARSQSSGDRPRASSSATKSD